jgi:peptidyl-prolyl cis-trans isomerase SurA
MKKILFSLFLAMTINAAYAVGDEVASGKLVELNTIVAIVNETPILQDTLDQRVNMVERQLESRNIPLPPLDILKNQVLNQLIQEQLQLQLAESRHIQIPQAQVNEQLQKIADQQKITIAELYQQATLDGFTRDSYREQLQDQMRIHELIQTTIAAKIVISPKDVTLYRNSQLSHATSGKEYRIENILIPLPASPTTQQITAAEEKANKILSEIKSGSIAFDQAAVRNSSGQFALEGGDLGFRPIAELPEIFAQFIVSMNPGDVYGPIRAGNGIQLIKLVEVKNSQQELTDEQIREALFKRKLEEAYPVWLASLESQAYIDRKM